MNQAGRYRMGDSYIHRLDPRTKILAMILIVIIVLSSAGWFGSFLSFSLIFVGVVISGVPVKRFFRVKKQMKVMFIILFLSQSLLTKGDPLITVGALVASGQGIALGLSTIIRLWLLYLSSSLLTSTTTPIKLTAGFESLLSPLGYIRVPVHQLAVLITAALRFIPTIIDEAEELTKAQKSRGAQFDAPDLRVRIKSMSAMLIPLLASTLRSADQLTLAMLSRCYSRQGTGVRVHTLRFGREDGIVFLVLVAATLTTILFS